MEKINLLNKEDRKALILDFISRLINRYPNMDTTRISTKLTDLMITEGILTGAYSIDASVSTNTITINRERVENANDETVVFLHQLMRILSGNINELNSGIIEEILSKLYPEKTLFCYNDEKTVANLLENVFGEEELVNSLFDNNKSLEVIADQKLNQEGFLSKLKNMMIANREDIRYPRNGEPKSELVNIIVFIFDSYINGADVSIDDLEAFKHLVKVWRTEIIEDYDEEYIYPGVADIIQIMDDKIAGRKKQQL